MEDYRCRRRKGIVTARHNHINPGLSNIARTLLGVRQSGISPGWKSLCPPNRPLHWYKLDRCHEGLFYDQHLLSGLCDDHSVAQRYIPGGACFPPLPIQCTLESVPTKPKDPRWATRATYAKDRTKIYSAAGPSKWLWVAAVRTLLVPGPANCGLIHTYLRNSSLSSPRHATVKLQTARYNCGALHTKAVRDRESCILKSNSVPHGAYCSLSWVTSDEALILLSARLCV